MSTIKFYRRTYQSIAPILLAMMRHGIRVDMREAKRQRLSLMREKMRAQEELAELVGANECRCSHGRKCHPIKQVNVHDGLLRKDGKPRAVKWKDTQPCTLCSCTTFTPRHQPLHARSDLASGRVVRFLYTTLGFPKIKKRGENTLTADEVAIRKCLLRATNLLKPKPRSTKKWEREPLHAIKCLATILRYREYGKLADFVHPDNFDIDERVRSFYKVTTETGRLASAQNPLKTGMNMQNLVRPSKQHPHTWIRKCFLPDKGHVWLEVDSSQIEDRITKVLSKVPSAIKAARMHPTVFDAHSAGAQAIFGKVLGCPPHEVDVKVEVSPGNTRRQIAKPVRHGANYGLGPTKLQEQLLKEGVVLSKALCADLLAAAQDETVKSYQRETRKRILRKRALTNSYGRTLDFHGCYMNDETYRRGYAFRAASENADHTNQDGLIPLWEYITSKGMESRILTQTHDSISVSCPPEEVWEVAAFLQQVMEAPREYEGVALSVPIGFKVGANWMCSPGYEYARLPERAELEKVARELVRGSV